MEMTIITIIVLAGVLTVGSIGIFLVVSLRDTIKKKSKSLFKVKQLSSYEWQFGNGVNDLEAFTLKLKEMWEKEESVSKFTLSVDRENVVPLANFLHDIEVLFDKITPIITHGKSVVLAGTLNNQQYILTFEATTAIHKDGEIRVDKEFVALLPTKLKPLKPSLMIVYKILKEGTYGEGNKFIVLDQDVISVTCNTTDAFFKKKALEQIIVTNSLSLIRKPKEKIKPLVYSEIKLHKQFGYYFNEISSSTLAKENTGDVNALYPEIGVRYKHINANVKGDSALKVMNQLAGFTNILLLGKLGTGKTRFLNRLIEKMVNERLDLTVILTSSTLFEEVLSNVELSSLFSSFEESPDKRGVVIIDDCFNLLSSEKHRSAITNMMDGTMYRNVRFIFCMNDVEGNPLTDLRADMIRPGRVDLFVETHEVPRANAKSLISEILANMPQEPKHRLNTAKVEALTAKDSAALSDYFQCVEQESLADILLNKIDVEVQQLLTKDATGIDSPLIALTDDENAKPARRVVRGIRTP